MERTGHYLAEQVSSTLFIRNVYIPITVLLDLKAKNEIPPPPPPPPHNIKYKTSIQQYSNPQGPIQYPFRQPSLPNLPSIPTNRHSHIYPPNPAMSIPFHDLSPPIIRLSTTHRKSQQKPNFHLLMRSLFCLLQEANDTDKILNDGGGLAWPEGLISMRIL